MSHYTGFVREVERWRGKVEAAKLAAKGHVASAPTDFLLAWMQVESGGDYTSVSKLEERGLFQIMWKTANGWGWSYARFRALSTDPAASLRDGLIEVEHLADTVVRRAADNGLPSPSAHPDFWFFVKLEHALPLYSKVVWARAGKTGRTPTMESALSTLLSLASFGRNGPLGRWFDDVYRVTKNSRWLNHVVRHGSAAYQYTQFRYVTGDPDDFEPSAKLRGLARPSIPVMDDPGPRPGRTSDPAAPEMSGEQILLSMLEPGAAARAKAALSAAGLTPEQRDAIEAIALLVS